MPSRVMVTSPAARSVPSAVEATKYLPMESGDGTSTGDHQPAREAASHAMMSTAKKLKERSSRIMRWKGWSAS